MNRETLAAPIRVVIADDHSVVRLGLSALLERYKDFAVVGEATDGGKAVELAERLHPDVVVMDLMMPRVDGVEATRRIRECVPGTRVLILTSFGTSADAARAVAAGASGAIVKDADNHDLLEAIRTVASGGKVFSAEISQAIEVNPSIPSLTDRQRKVLESVTRGLSNPEIAKQFGISIDAVKQHLNAVFLKLGAANRSEAVAIALRRQLLKL